MKAQLNGVTVCLMTLFGKIINKKFDDENKDA